MGNLLKTVRGRALSSHRFCDVSYMRLKKTFKALTWIQAIYMLLTAVWGLLDIDSFMVVTGKKTDIWLVKTVSVLLVPICLCLVLGLLLKANPLLVILVAMTTSIGLAAIDFYYSANNVI